MDFMTIRESADGRSRLVERRDGTFWAQEIYTDEQGRKCWRVAPVDREQALPALRYPRTTLWRRLRFVLGI